jgi:hypothetical protein
VFFFLLLYCSLTLGQVFLECEKPSSYAAGACGSLIWQLSLSLTLLDFFLSELPVMFSPSKCSWI